MFAEKKWDLNVMLQGLKNMIKTLANHYFKKISPFWLLTKQ